MACSDYLCPGNFTVYINTDSVDIDQTSPAPVQGDNFVRIPEVLTWTLESSTDEPDAFRTADTGGSRVTPCGGLTTWTVTVSTKICLGDWLYEYLLKGGADLVDGWYVGGKPVDRAWFYLSFDGSGPPTDTGPTNNGVYVFGAVTPPGFGGDNNTDEASEAEFTIQVSQGPFFPNFP